MIRENEAYTTCPLCSYQGATKGVHPMSGELFVSCPRCGHWRQHLDKKGTSISTKDTNAYIDETETHYIVGGGGYGGYCIRKGDELEHLGSLSDKNRDEFETKAQEMIKFKKADHITYTMKQLGVWFEFDFINKTKRELKDDDY